MDELDLVRLARPEAATPDPDALARVKALAFGAPAPTSSAATPATDDELVELTPIAPKARRPRRLALVAVAAAVVTVAGGLTFATRHTSNGLGTTDTSAVGVVGNGDDALRAALDGRWWIERATLQGKDVVFDAPGVPASRSTAVFADTAAGTFGLLTCDAFTAHYTVRGGQLAVTPTLSGESRCADPAARAAQEDMVRLVTGTPTVEVSGDAAVIRSDEGTVRLRRSTTPTDDTPTMAELFGRHFVVDSVVVEGRPVPIDAGVLDVADGFTVAVNVGCNLLSAPTTIEDGVLVIPSIAQTHAPCTAVFAAKEEAADALLTSRPTIILANGSLSIRSGSGELLAHEPVHISPAGRELDGTWRVSAAKLGDQQFELGADTTDPRAVTFDVRSGGYSVSMCDTLVGKGFDVPDGRLTLEGSLSGIEAGCTDVTRRARQDIVVKILTGRPLVKVSDVEATFTAGDDRLTLRRGTSVGTTPTMADLAGHTFTITSLTEGDTVLAVGPTAAFSFPSAVRVGVTIGCNGMGGSAAIDAGQLRVTEFGSTLIGCPPAQAAAERAIGKLLGAPADISLDAGALRLSGNGVVFLAVERPGTPVTTVVLPPTTPPPSQP